MRVNLHIVATAIAIWLQLGVLHAQKGPGGVSVETGTLSGCGGAAESTCGVWLDASSLTTLANGDNVSSWPDISLSADCDNAIVPGSAQPPIFRNDPAGTINGLPTITFDDNKYFVLSSSDDLNTTRVTYDKLVFMAFRTSEDVASKQTIYEEGGTVRGFNIMIHQNELIIGAYDKQGNDNDDGLSNAASPNPNNGRTPAWGYTYISRPIQPNTTYILAAQFKTGSPAAPSSAGTIGYGDNVIGDNDFFLKGWLNGDEFGGLTIPDLYGNPKAGGNFNGFNNVGNLGTLFDHPNPCGLGAVNDDTVDKDQVKNNGSGDWPFAGKLAELCYYKDEISETQRIIVQNYLASKYIASLTSDDYYEYEFGYGQDLIGIGREVNPEQHNLSQGKNAFRISATSTFSSSPIQYFHTGHNGDNYVWTPDNVPGQSENIERLERIWRVDRTASFNSAIDIEVDEDLLPPPPPGYNTANAKLVLLVDDTSPNLPDFESDDAKVIEFDTGTGDFEYETSFDFADGSFYTFAWLKPEVNFELAEDFAIEADPAPSSFQVALQVNLNFTPFGNVGGTNINYTVVAGTATKGVDYDFGDGMQTSGVMNIPQNSDFGFIPISIINDVLPEDPSTETFSVILTSAVDPTVLIGPADTLVFTIYDDDPPPKFEFQVASSTVNESVGTHQVTILRTGDATGVATCRARWISAGTTARSVAVGMDPDDFDFNQSQTVVFADGQSSATIDVTILDDPIDEEDNETCLFRIDQFTGAVGAGNILEHTVNISDNDDPVAFFASPTQTGFETQSAPSLTVNLSPVSSRPVVVDFTMTPGTASFNSPQDYGGFPSGSIVFPPFSEDAFIGPFFVYTDETIEGPETVIFKLVGTTPQGGATQVPTEPDSLIYTILDYAEFEWRGAAGVGQTTDNIIWIDATQEPTGNRGSLANRSPYSIAINDLNNNSANNTAGAINGQNALDFNGSSTPGNADAYEIQNNTKINTAGTVDRLSYFFVFSPDVGGVPNGGVNNNPTTAHARLIYEQGGGTRGTSIYLHQNRLFFHAWNNANDDGNDNTATTDTIEGNQAPWGHNGQGNFSTRDVWAYSRQVINGGENYVVSCHYNNFSNEPLTIYVNGVKGIYSGFDPAVNPFGVGRLWGHAGRIGLGAVINATRFHFARNSVSDGSCAFDGKISEFISFHEPQMNDVRRVILENYLSAKYDIALDQSQGVNSVTPQLWDLTDPEQNNFFEDYAGIGYNSNLGQGHTNSAGPNTVLQVSTGIDEFEGTEDYLMWGHNGVELTNTWPTSDPSLNVLPPGINERSGQIWKFYETGSVDEIDNVYINFSASDNAAILNDGSSINLLKLLTHTNADPNDFSNATVYDLAALPGGFSAEFRSIPVVDGMYMALGNTSNYFNTPLPIELLSFNAQLKGTYVDINWQTATEINNDYFVVERAGEDLVWEPIITTPGAGNSNSLLEYKEKDREPLQGVSYYRLKQVDFDGAFTYSDPVSIFNAQVEDNEDVFMYPNPSSMGSVFIRVPYATKDFETIISLIDLSGKVLIQDRYDSDATVHELNYSNLPAGIYLVNVRSEALNQTKKLVIE